MKQQPPIYDSFCLEDQCYNKQSAFFKFNTHNRHILEGHEVKQIHPMTFFHILRAGNKQKCFSETDLISSVDKVQSMIDSVIAQISVFLKETIFEPFISKVEKEAGKWSDLSVEDFDKKLREGNYAYLKILKEIQKDGKESVMSLIRSQLDSQLEEIYNQIDGQKESVMNMIMSQVSYNHQSSKHFNKENEKQIQQFQQERQPDQIIENSIGSKQEYQNMMNKTRQMEQSFEIVSSKQSKLTKQSLVKMQAEPQIQSSFSFWKSKAQNDKNLLRQNLQIQEEQQSDSDEAKPSVSEPQKNKIIGKQSKIRGKKKLRVKSEDIASIGYQELIIKQIYTSHSAFKKIQFLAPGLKTLHVFDQKFLYKATLSQLFKDYPNLQVLTLNCYVDYKCLSSFPDQKLSQFNRLCFRWDMQRFHVQYFLETSFPTKDLLQLRYKKTKKTICYIVQPKLKNNSHYMLLSKSQPISLYFSKTSSMQVYAGCLKNLLSREITKLKYLKINGHYELENEKSHVYDITQADESCQSLLIKNKEINQIFLHNLVCSSNFKNKQTIFSYPFGRTLRQISLLPQLQIFSLINDEKSGTYLLPAAPIKRLKKLEYLTLINIQFDKSSEQNRFQHLTLLQQFCNLKHLNLYKCRTIDSHVIECLKEESLLGIQFLNLGQTSIQKDCLETIAKMEKLVSLNIEETKINGRQLITMLLIYFSLFSKLHPLRNLNIKTKMFKWKIRAMEIISNLKKEHSEENRNPEISDPSQILNPINNILSSKGQTKTIDDMLFQVINAHQKNSPLLDETKRTDYQHYRELFTDEDIQNLQHHAPNLQYLNISNHLNLTSIDLTQYKALKVVCKDKLIAWSGKTNPGVKIIQLEEQKPHQKQDNNE